MERRSQGLLPHPARHLHRGGSTWSTSFVTDGNGDEVQPALSADSHGLHLLYYHRHPNNTIDVLTGTSPNGTSFSTRRITSQPFLGALTIPQFDPIIAFGYMGDYIANVSNGSNAYFAWGDNRHSVTDFLFPNGRNDPDVFFATAALFARSIDRHLARHDLRTSRAAPVTSKRGHAE